MKCPFYGFHAVPDLRLLVQQSGNQCGLVTASYSPCYLEIEGNEPDLDQCVLKDTEHAARFASFKRHHWNEGERSSNRMTETKGPSYDAGPLTEVSLHVALSPTETLIVEYFPPAPDTAAVRLTFSNGHAYTFDARTGMLVREVWPTAAAADRAGGQRHSATAEP